jgi:hypothetical protein
VWQKEHHWKAKQQLSAQHLWRKRHYLDFIQV